MKKTLLILTGIVSAATLSNAAMLFTSNFDNNTGATVLAGNSDNSSGSASLGVTWSTPTSGISGLGNLSAISNNAGFAIVQNGNNAFSNDDVVYVNENLNAGGTQGYSVSFTVDAGNEFNLSNLSILARHTNNAGSQEQVFVSDLVFSLSGGTLGAPVTDLKNDFDYNGSAGFIDHQFDLTGTSLGAGTYTLDVSMSDFSGGGAYAVYDGITLEGEAIPEPSSAALIGLASLGILLRRRK